MDKNLVELFKEQSYEAYKLSCAVSISPKVEIELLRKMRFALFPKMDAGVEADIWFSPLVQTRTPLAIVLFPEALEILRKDLASDQVLLQNAWRVTEDVHQNITPALRLEEEIVYLALLDTDNEDKIEEKLNLVLTAIVRENRTGLAQWALRALPHLPFKARMTGTALILALVAGTRLGQTIQLGPLPQTINWENLSWAIPKDIPKIPIGVRLTNTTIEFGDTNLLQANVLEIPKTSPLLLEVSWGTGQNLQTYLVTWEIGQAHSIGGWSDDIQIRTVLGERYVISSILEKWEEVGKVFQELSNDTAYGELGFLIDRVLESFSAGLWQISIYEAFISLIKDLMSDLDQGEPLHEILSIVTIAGFHPRTHWKKHEVYISQSSVFDQVLKEMLENTNTGVNQRNLISQFTLTMLATTDIHNYIFASSQIQDSIGASELVSRATSSWIFDALNEVAASHNIKNPDRFDWSYSNVSIEIDGNLKAEVVGTSGNNVFILFKEKEYSRKFVQALTVRLLKEAPGLLVLAQHLDDFDFTRDGLSPAFEFLRNKMHQHRLSREFSMPTMGLGITALCDFTGQPAVSTLGSNLLLENRPRIDDQEVLVSSTIFAKRASTEQANHRLANWLQESTSNLEFPYALEKLGRVNGKEGYIAVIHIVVNRLSEHYQNIAQEIEKGHSTQDMTILNQTYIRAIRRFTRNVTDISRAALQAVVALTARTVEMPAVSRDRDTGKFFSTVRPIVFREGEVTLVCNGAIGVEFAARFLETFRGEAQKRGLDLHACAGIAIVKMHFPFIRAYKLSEELCTNAQSLASKEDCSALDWHFAQSGLSGSVDSMRRQEFTVEAGRMHLRPLTLDAWHSVEAVTEAFNGSSWHAKRNKILGLREALRKGPAAVQEYCHEYDLVQLPEIAGEEAQKTGWKNGVCQYYDAIELLDHHMLLEKQVPGL